MIARIDDVLNLAYAVAVMVAVVMLAHEVHQWHQEWRQAQAPAALEWRQP